MASDTSSSTAGSLDRPVPRGAGGEAPPDIEAPGLGDALLGLALGRRFRGLGRHDGRTVLRVLPMAVADFVAEAFETDALQAAIAWRGRGIHRDGPWSASTAAVLLGDLAGNDGGAAGPTVYAEGGPGTLTTALAAAARAAGAEIRTGAEVAAIPRDGRATGVVLAGGDEIEAHAVVSAIDPKRTLTGLVDPCGRADAALARGQHPHTRDGLEGQPRVVGPADLPRGARQ